MKTPSSGEVTPDTTTPGLQEPDQFDLDEERPRRPTSTVIQSQTNENGMLGLLLNLREGG